MSNPRARYGSPSNRWVQQALGEVRQDPAVKRVYPGWARVFRHRHPPGTRKTLTEYPGGRCECVYDERGSWMIHVVYHKTEGEA